MKRKTPEAELLAACRSYLAFSGYPAFRINVAAFGGEHKGRRRFVRTAPPGWPDLVTIVDGVFVGLECKAPKGRLSESQKEMQREIEDAGGIYQVVHTLDDVFMAIGKARNT